MKSEQKELLGVGLMMLASALGAVDAVLVRQLSPEVHPFVMGFTRSLFGLLVVLPWILCGRVPTTASGTSCARR